MVCLPLCLYSDPVELLLDDLAGAERLHELAYMQVRHLDLWVLGHRVILLGHDDTLWTKVNRGGMVGEGWDGMEQRGGGKKTNKRRRMSKTKMERKSTHNMNRM